MIDQLILALPAVSFLYLARFNLFTVPTNLFEVFVYLVAIAAFVTRKRWRVLSRTEQIIVATSVILVAIATVISPDKRATLGIVKGWIVPALLVGWMMSRVLVDQKKVARSLSFWRASAVGLAIIALMQQFSVVALWWSNKAPDVAQYVSNHRSVAIYNSPNALAIVLALGFIVAMYIRKTKIDLILLLIILAGLLATGSRAGLVAGLVGLITYYLWQNKRQLGALVVFCATLIAFNPITLSMLALRHPNNADIRVEIWKSSWELISQKPLFGYGLQSFQNAFQELTLHRVNYDEFITPYAVHPHNIFLYTWFLFGVVGVLVLVILIVRAFAHLYRQNSKLAALAASLLVVIIVQGMVDNSLWKNDLIIWFVAAVLLVFSNTVHQDDMT